MFLSVIVPIYNAESTLKSCVESILQQKIERMEIILVDDNCETVSKTFHSLTFRSLLLRQLNGRKTTPNDGAEILD